MYGSRWLLVMSTVACGVRFGDGGGRDAGGATDAAPKDAPADAITGTHCGRDPVTHVELCSGVSVCPGLLVDPDAMPGCGFVPGTLDLACLCGDMLCPMGKPKTCPEAKRVLESSNVVLVCSQVSDRLCKNVAQ